MVVREDRRGDVLLHAVLDQVLRRARDRVRRVVHVATASPSSSVATPLTTSDAGGSRRRPTGCPRRRRCRSASARPRRTLFAPDMHAGQRGPPVVALHLPDAGQDRPRDAVLRPTFGTTSGSWRGSSSPPRWTPGCAALVPRSRTARLRRPANSMVAPPMTSIGTASKASSAMSMRPMIDGPSDRRFTGYPPRPARCRLPASRPAETTVTVYWLVLDLAGWVELTCWLMPDDERDRLPAGAERADRVDRAAARGDLLLRGPQRGHARRGVAVLQGAASSRSPGRSSWRRRRRGPRCSSRCRSPRRRRPWSAPQRPGPAA